METIHVVCLPAAAIGQWPDRVCCRPILGDKIESDGGDVMKIESIKHRMGSWTDARGRGFVGPILVLQLVNL